MKKSFRIVLVVVVLAAVAGGGYLWQRHAGAVAQGKPAAARTTGGAPAGRAAAGGPPPGMPVEAAQVTVDTVVRTITAIGTLESNEAVVVRPEIAGRIVKIGFNEGQRVKKGTVLFLLDDSTYDASAAQAEASLDLSRKNYDRASELHKKGAGSTRTRDEALALLKVDEAKASMAMTMLDKTRIRAPFDGIVGLRKVSPGDYVQPGQDLVNLDDVDVLKVDFRVPQIALSEVRVGQKIGITVDALPGRSFEGEVYAIDPQVDPSTRSMALRARIPNPDGVLRPGLFVTVTVIAERHEGAVLVPEEAIVPIGGQRLVFRIDAGKVKVVPVTLGVRRPGQVEITSGLKAGDTVVTAGQQKLRDGAPVMVLPAQAPAKAAAK